MYTDQNINALLMRSFLELTTLKKKTSFIMSHPAFSCSKLAIKTPEQGVKYVHI